MTAEHVFPWMPEDYSGLAEHRAAANLLAEREWPRLYDETVLRANTVPVAATIYVNDLYVERAFAEETAALQDFELGFRHAVRLAFEVLYAAGGAFGVGAAAMQDVHPGVLLYREDQPLALLHVERPHTFDLDSRHALLLILQSVL